jgi:hypothetical protein
MGRNHTRVRWHRLLRQSRRCCESGFPISQVKMLIHSLAYAVCMHSNEQAHTHTHAHHMHTHNNINDLHYVCVSFYLRPPPLYGSTPWQAHMYELEPIPADQVAPHVSACCTCTVLSCKANSEHMTTKPALYNRTQAQSTSSRTQALGHLRMRQRQEQDQGTCQAGSQAFILLQGFFASFIGAAGICTRIHALKRNIYMHSRATRAFALTRAHAHHTHTHMTNVGGTNHTEGVEC